MVHVFVSSGWAAYTQIPTILTKNTTQNIHIHILLPVNTLAFLGTDYILFFRGERVSSQDITTSTTLVYGTLVTAEMSILSFLRRLSFHLVQ